MNVQGRVALIEADCLEALQGVPSGSVNLILCDLPYGTTQNTWDCGIPLPDLWREYERVLASQGAVLLFSQGPFTARLICSREDWFRYKLTWVKSKSTNFLNVKRQPLRRHEDVCVFYPRQPKYHPQMSEGDAYDKGVRKNQLTGSYGDFKPVRVSSEGGRYPTDVVYHKTAESEGTVHHATQKPVGLAQYLIRTYSEPGDVVLDNAFGSGSFLVAAALEGRNAIGIELNQGVEAFKGAVLDLVGVAKQRLEETGVCAVATSRRGNLAGHANVIAWAMAGPAFEALADFEAERPVIIPRQAHSLASVVVGS